MNKEVLNSPKLMYEFAVKKRCFCICSGCMQLDCHDTWIDYDKLSNSLRVKRGKLKRHFKSQKYFDFYQMFHEVKQ